MKNWTYYNHNFEYRKYYDDRGTPWIGHTFFAYDLVSNLKPKIIVELGTHKGTSFYSMVEAIRDEGLDTVAFAVDSWEGDEHAGTPETGYNPREVYEFVKHMLRRFYGREKARMVKKFFADALADFEDNSINILHIDGLHTYEAVKNDYEKWKPKLAEDSVIMFHDISVADFGVWKVWEEVKKDYEKELQFEFTHSYGLGVAIKGERYKEIFREALKEDKNFIKHYSDIADKSEIKFTKESLDQEVKRLEEDLEAYITRVKQLQDDIKNLHEENSVIKRESLELKRKYEELQREFTKSTEILNSLISRKVIKVYRKLMMIIGRDVVR